MEIDEDLVRERVQRLIHTEGISQAAFAKRIGRQASNMSAILSTGENGRHIPRGFVSDVIKGFPNVSREWILFGEGAMYVDELDSDKLLEETRPRMPMNVSGHRLKEYLEGTGRLMCDDRPLIKQFPDYDFTLIVKFDTMSPRYERGDEIALKKVEVCDYKNGNGNSIDAKSIEFGHEYVIDTSSGPKFKILYEHGNYFLCRAYNQEKYPDFLIPKSEVCAIYRVVGMIRV